MGKREVASHYPASLRDKMFVCNSLDNVSPGHVHPLNECFSTNFFNGFYRCLAGGGREKEIRKIIVTLLYE